MIGKMNQRKLTFKEQNTRMNHDAEEQGRESHLHGGRAVSELQKPQLLKVQRERVIHLTKLF